MPLFDQETMVKLVSELRKNVARLKDLGNRSQVQSSTFRVKEKEGIEDRKAWLKRPIFPSNCQFGSKFWITPEQADAFLVNMHPKCSPRTRIEL